MPSNTIANISVENARILFKNFAGKATKFNPEGKRNFCLIVDNDLADNLKDIGWNIKYLNPRDPDEQPQAYLQVAVAFENFPPNVFMIAGGKKTKLNEDTINVLDYAEIQSIDLIIRPYQWELPSGKSGVKAYLKNMYVTIVENEFEAKYRDLDEAEDDLPF